MTMNQKPVNPMDRVAQLEAKIYRLKMLFIHPTFGSGKDLTPRQTEVAKLAAMGFTYNEIGEALNISPNTAHNVFLQVKKKTGLDKAQLTRWMIYRACQLLDIPVEQLE